MVRLLLPNSPCSATNDQLSIPQWCDCCIGYGLWLWAMVLLSIPQWCDCCHLSNSPFVLNPKLSIPQWCDCCVTLCSLSSTYRGSFNPTMVRLLPFIAFTIYEGKLSFNPTMVRLLPVAQGESLLYMRFFQSHNGAIAAQRSAAKRFALSIFQSHNGAIAARTLINWL